MILHFYRCKIILLSHFCILFACVLCIFGFVLKQLKVYKRSCFWFASIQISILRKTTKFIWRFAKHKIQDTKLASKLYQANKNWELSIFRTLNIEFSPEKHLHNTKMHKTKLNVKFNLLRNCNLQLIRRLMFAASQMFYVFGLFFATILSYFGGKSKRIVSFVWVYVWNLLGLLLLCCVVLFAFESNESKE